MKGAIKDAINEIIQEADECKENANSDFEQGRLLGLAEAITIFQDCVAGDPEIGELIPFDVDRRYLIK